jgi:hypothetical protein
MTPIGIMMVRKALRNKPQLTRMMSILHQRMYHRNTDLQQSGALLWFQKVQLLQIPRPA